MLSFWLAWLRFSTASLRCTSRFWPIWSLRAPRSDLGREGLCAQQVLRILVLYLMLKGDFEQLEFHLCDSPTYRSFCLLGLGEEAPKRSALHKNQEYQLHPGSDPADLA